MEIPVAKNYEYDIEIDGIGVNGEGIGRINGFTMFVEGALPGERVRIKAVKVTKNYGYGKLVGIIEPSPDRVDPLCQYSKRCGGCQLQHVSYEAQLKFKTQLVKDAIERIGKLKGIEVKPTIGMENPLRYRNKAQFPVGLVKDRLAIGFYAPRSHDIIDMDKCHIQHEINDTIVDIVRRFIHEYNIPVYNEITHKGIVRHIVSKIGFKSNQVMVLLVTNGVFLPKKEVLIERLKEGVPGIASIVQNINSKRTNVILGEQNTVLWGKDHIIDWIGDLKFKISPLSFFQVNPIQTEVLYKKALEYAELTGKEQVIDAYCGIGTISLFMARKAGRILGIEVVGQAVEDARTNAAINGIDNVEFLDGEAEEVMPKMVQEGFEADVVVVDPPRKGCDQKFLDAVIEIAPKRVVYVSCNPATLARDLGYLSGRGYNVKEVQPVDMFPYTVHVETVVLLSK